jgi:hypothetical protein
MAALDIGRPFFEPAQQLLKLLVQVELIVYLLEPALRNGDVFLKLFQDLLFFLEHQILEEVHSTFDLVKHVEEKLVVMSSFALFQT